MGTSSPLRATRCYISRLTPVLEPDLSFEPVRAAFLSLRFLFLGGSHDSRAPGGSEEPSGAGGLATVIVFFVGPPPNLGRLTF